MKKLTILGAALLSLLLTSQPASAQDEESEQYVYLYLGQEQKETDNSLSPVSHFMKTMTEALKAEAKVAILESNQHGNDLRDMTRSEKSYQKLLGEARKALKKGSIKGVMLQQDHGNAGDREWSRQVKRVYDNLLADLNLSAQDVPLFVAEVASQQEGGQYYMMNDMIHGLRTTIPSVHVISSKGCSCQEDHEHLTPAGYDKLGQRYAEAALAVLDDEKYNWTADIILPEFKEEMNDNLYSLAGQLVIEDFSKHDSREVDPGMYLYQGKKIIIAQR